MNSTPWGGGGGGGVEFHNSDYVECCKTVLACVYYLLVFSIGLSNRDCFLVIQVVFHRGEMHIYLSVCLSVCLCVSRYSKMGAGRNCSLTVGEEEEIVECLVIMVRWGFGFTRNEALQLVGEYAVHRSVNPFKSVLPTQERFYGFMKRHPRLTTRLPEQLKAARAKSCGNPTVVKHWFELVKETL